MRRHRTLLGTLTLSLVVVSAAAAQGKVKANFGVLGGAAFAKVSGSDVDGEAKTRVGYALGGFVTIGATPNVAIEPEVLLVQKGAKDERTGGTFTLRLTYIEVPVLLKLRVPAKSGGLISPHIYAGPALGFKAGCNLKGTDGSITLSGKCESQTFDFHPKSTDFGLVFGGGVDVGRAMIDVRYDLGLSKVGDPSAPDVKTRTFYLLAGWTFRAPR